MKMLGLLGSRFDLVLVPSLLTLVAFNQIRMAWAENLTPWKGGGFGMFGSLDSPKMRFISCEARDSEGRVYLIPLDFHNPRIGQTLGRRIRCKPDAMFLRLLGQVVLDSDLVEPKEQKLELLSKIESENPFLRNVRELRGERPLLFLRIKDPKNPTPLNAKTIRASAVRLQIWKLRFDPDTLRIFTVPVGDSCVLGDWS